MEFEFALSEKVFCVKRTLPKHGRASFQVCKCQSRDGWEGGPATDFIPIEKTEYEADFDAWVKENIGLDAKAFSAAVLLGQGKTDALLCHKPQARHNILSQIIESPPTSGFICAPKNITTSTGTPPRATNRNSIKCPPSPTTKSRNSARDSLP